MNVELTDKEEQAIIAVDKLQDKYVNDVVEAVLAGSQSMNTIYGRLAYFMIGDYEYDLNYYLDGGGYQEIMYYWKEVKPYLDQMIESVQTTRNMLINSYLCYVDNIKDFSDIKSEEDLDSLNDVSADYYLGNFGGAFPEIFKNDVQDDLNNFTLQQRRELNSLLTDAGFQPLFKDNKILYTEDLALNKDAEEFVAKMKVIEDDLKKGDNND